MAKSKRAVITAFISAFFAFSPFSAGAYQLDQMTDVPAVGDFVLNQTKTEIRLDPGESASRSVSVTNRSGVDLIVSVSVEDFSAEAGKQQDVNLLGAAAGLYSLKDYLQPEASEFILRHGEKLTLPVAIKIPANAQPGGLYGAVIFAAQPASAAPAGKSNIQTISRLASLFFVRINGEALESGELQDFKSVRTFYLKGPAAFEFNYKNSGNVYLNPYGELKITDIFGREVYRKWISPYFVMPGAIRQQKEVLEQPSLLGVYQATLKLNRGYGNRLDQKSVYFFVFPLQYVAIAAAALALALWLAWRIRISFKKS